MASHRDSCHLAPPAYDSLSLYGLLEKSGLINPGAPHVSFCLGSNRLELAQRTRRLVRSRLMRASAGYSATRPASSFPCRLHLGCFAAYMCMVAARAAKRGRGWPRGSRYSRPSRGLEVSDCSHFASTAGSMCITIPVDPSAAIPRPSHSSDERAHCEKPGSIWPD